MRLDPDGDISSFPRRAALPIVSGTPAGSAWFWEEMTRYFVASPWPKLGRLNLLTSKRILRATKTCVQTGEVVSLNLPLNVPEPAFFGRVNMRHSIHSIGPGAYDDEYAINTQSSSQWDGFRHFADPSSGFFYNGLKSDEIDVQEGKSAADNRVLGIDTWARRGLAGRGVLLDIYEWKKQAYNPFTDHLITADDLKNCAKAQNVSFEIGDILLIRTGWLQAYSTLSPKEKTERAALALTDHHYAGVEASETMKDFLHDHYFAAAASDSANFEAWPPPSMAESLHASMLPLWGMPIGELWNLEELGQKCKAMRRWTFLLTSAPNNVPGGIGSPPNALALF